MQEMSSQLLSLIVTVPLSLNSYWIAAIGFAFYLLSSCYINLLFLIFITLTFLLCLILHFILCLLNICIFNCNCSLILNALISWLLNRCVIIYLHILLASSWLLTKYALFVWIFKLNITFWYLKLTYLNS